MAKNTSTQTQQIDTALINKMVKEALESGEIEFELPDDMIVSKFHARLANLESMVKALTRELQHVKALADDKTAPAESGERIDPIEAAKEEKTTKKAKK